MSRARVVPVCWLSETLPATPTALVLPVLGVVPPPALLPARPTAMLQMLERLSAVIVSRWVA